MSAVPTRSPLAASRCALAALSVIISAAAAQAWDAPGHRAITFLALDGLQQLAPEAPAFIFDPDQRHAIAWQASEADRWRGTRSAYLTHENAMEHFIDIEDLDEFGLTLRTINPLRARFIRDMSVARYAHREGDSPRTDGAPERPPYNERLDPTGQKEFPGFLPHAIVEHHAKLTSSLKTWRMLTRLNEPARAPQLLMAQSNIRVTMGMLSHFVGDAAQPLHTTKHFNGFVGPNPQQFTTANTFHAKIDGGILTHHALNYHTLKPTQTFTTIVDPLDPWQDLMTYIERSHEKVIPLYVMEKDGSLMAEPGKIFITERLNDAASMLAALYASAWANSAITDKDVSDFVRYDGFDIKSLPNPTEQDKPNP